MSKICNVHDSASLVVDCKSLTLRCISLSLYKVVVDSISLGRWTKDTVLIHISFIMIIIYIIKTNLFGSHVYKEFHDTACKLDKNMIWIWNLYKNAFVEISDSSLVSKGWKKGWWVSGMGKSYFKLVLFHWSSKFILNSISYHSETRHNKSAIWGKKKICVFTVRQPTLIFGPDPKLFYGTFSRKLFKYPIFAFECSFSLFWQKRVKYHSSSVEMHSRCHPTSILL